MKTVLVTGASGFVGAHIAKGLAALGFRVFTQCRSTLCAPEVVDIVEGSFQLDLSDKDKVEDLIKKINPEVIVHAAAMANSTICQKDPQQARLSNVQATSNLVAHSRPDVQILHVSTDLIFDGSDAPPGGFSEEHNPLPRSVYGITKAKAEQEVLRFRGPRTVLRTCLVYGPKIGSASGFLGWLKGSLEMSSQVTLYIDEWRTPIYSEDIVEAISRVISVYETQKTFVPILHLAGADRLSRYDFGVKLADIYGFDKSYIIPSQQSENTSNVPRPRDVSMSAQLLFERYGLKTCTAEEGLKKLKQGEQGHQVSLAAL